MNGHEPFTVSYSPSIRDEQSWAGETYPTAVIVCAIGFFLRLILSAPVLNIIGIDYGGEDASVIAKIHPGTYFVLASFFILIGSRHNPVEGLLRVARQQKAFFGLFAAYILAFLYWALRGPKGIGMLIDVHLVVPICAMVFSYATRGQLRAIVYGFAGFAVLNSTVGIVESLTHMRLFPFNAEWEVLQQDYFRASAFMGHPLTNAAFTAVSMFVLMSLRMRQWLKTGIFVIMLASLVAFGGRSALGLAVMGLMVLGAAGLWNYFRSQGLTVLRLAFVFLAIAFIPALCAGLVIGALHSGMGDRLMAYNSLNDESAAMRLAVWHIFDFMSTPEMIFGIDGDRVNQLGMRAGFSNPTSDIENPWVLMFMSLGGIMFTLWLLALIIAMGNLAAGAPLGLQLAVVEYFAIASTSNSFGRKDPVLFIMVAIVICSKRLEKLGSFNHQETHP